MPSSWSGRRAACRRSTLSAYPPVRRPGKQSGVPVRSGGAGRLRRTEGGRDGGDALAAAGQAEPVRRRAAHRHRRAGRRGQRRLGLGASGADLGPVADDLDGDVADLEAGLADEPRRLGEQRDAGGTGELGTRGAEVGAEVADARRREDRVAGRVRGDVGVGVAVETALPRPEQPGRPTARAPTRSAAYAWTSTPTPTRGSGVTGRPSSRSGRGGSCAARPGRPA